jgi:hypothetical protein
VLSVLRKERGNVEAFIFAGDIASLTSKPSSIKELENEGRLIRKLLLEVEKLNVPFYFVLGNRDEILLELLKKSGSHLFDELLEIIQMSYFLRFVGNKKFKVNENVFITGDIHHTNKQTILLTHEPPLVELVARDVVKREIEDFEQIQEIKKHVFLYFVGHTHYGHIWENYFNLGFVHRDDLHGSKDLWGFYWLFEIENRILRTFEIKFIEKNTRIRRFTCEKHKQYGEWIIHWRKCPICYLEKDLRKTTFEV